MTAPNQADETAQPEAERERVNSRCICGGYGPRLTAMADMLLPSGEAGEHFRHARVEVLKGLRAMIDQRIESLSQPAQGTKLNVE